ncbi:MAG: redoxin domain-containing protein [Acidobacteriota bacterium]|nr:redoxin domain-containing protein [Blastocatellia bacterium]MDW8237975.1 redoxin domain-containing protein [Acidobacteriota bacterium]
MKLTVLLFVLVLTVMGLPARHTAQSKRSAQEYVEEINRLLFEAEAADINDLEADARRQRARTLAAQYAARVKAGNPTGADRLWLAYLYLFANDTERTIVALRELLDDKSLTEEYKQQARLLLVGRLSGLGRMDEAEAMLSAISASSFNVEEARTQAHEALTVAYTRQGQMEKAVRHQEQALADARQSGLIPRIWYTGVALAQLYVAMDRKADAVKLMDELKAYFERQMRLAGGEPWDAIETALEQVETTIAQLQLIDKPAPDIAPVKWIKETPTTLAALRGQVVALEFWAAWCPDCRQFIPELRNWHMRYSKSGLKILSLTRFYGFNGRETGKASEAEELAFLSKFKLGRNIPYGVAIDDGQKGFDAYHARSIPTLAIIDRAGRVRMIFTWHTNPALAEYMIKKLLAEAAPTQSNPEPKPPSE